MLDTALLRTLLNDDLLSTVSKKDGRRFVQLKETGADAKLKRVDICDLPEGSLLINLDKFEQPKSLFKGTLGERQRCDYVLITSLGAQPMLVFIELKSATVKASEIERQFKGAECIIDYCDATLNRFHDQNGLLKQCEKRFVVFYRPRLAKLRTRPVSIARKNDTPERAFRYPAPHNPTLRALVVP